MNTVFNIFGAEFKIVVIFVVTGNIIGVKMNEKLVCGFICNLGVWRVKFEKYVVKIIESFVLFIGNNFRIG